MALLFLRKPNRAFIFAIFAFCSRYSRSFVKKQGNSNKNIRKLAISLPCNGNSPDFSRFPRFSRPFSLRRRLYSVRRVFSGLEKKHCLIKPQRKTFAGHDVLGGLALLFVLQRFLELRQMRRRVFDSGIFCFERFRENAAAFLLVLDGTFEIVDFVMRKRDRLISYADFRVVRTENRDVSVQRLVQTVQRRLVLLTFLVHQREIHESEERVRMLGK